MTTQAIAAMKGRKIATLIAIGMLSSLSFVQAQQPNILLVIADDVGLDPVPGYLGGQEKASMPNLQALMSQGLTFDAAWANPVCSPTRATVMTGRYSNQTGVLDPTTSSLLSLDEHTLFEQLSISAPDYATAVIGKWHIGGQPSDADHPNQQGVPHFTGLLSGGVPSYSSWAQSTNGAAQGMGSYITETFTDSAIAWIGRQEAPWFCWLAYTAPHKPFHLPPTNMHTFDDLVDDPDSIAANPLPYYLAMLESVDSEMGRLLDSLSWDEVSNTVVIFLGDNGTPASAVQSPFTSDRAKGSLHQGGVLVPMVISGPGVTRADQRESALVNTTDLFATIVELTGGVMDVYENSKSLLPLLSQAGLSHRSCLRAESGGTLPQAGWVQRNQTHMYIQGDNSDPELYNLSLDPFENDNLWSSGLSPELASIVEELSIVCTASSSPPSVSNCPADLNEDGLVGVGDVLLLLGDFGLICPE